MMRRGTLLGCCRALSAICLIASASCAVAQFGAPPPDTRSARERALIDIAGQWVAVVNEDWRWRMVTPPPGDTASIPLNPAGQQLAGSWDLEHDTAEGNLCRAFGPPGLIRQPTRIRIDWDGDDTLKLEFDAGRQTRLLHFAPGVAPAAHSLQGHSVAAWYRQPQSRGVLAAAAPADGGSLHVTTTHMTAGYLRANGVPYSDQATVKEFFNTFTLPGDAGSWLIVTTIVNDPTYLMTDLIMSTQFRRETRRGGWNPRPCEIPEPLNDHPVGLPEPF